MLRYIILPILLCLLTCITNGQTAFPTPAESKERLFYLQRDPNTNTIIYDINYLADGSINVADPVHVYWIKYMKGGLKEELLDIEKKFAYGAKTEMIDAAEKSFKLNLVAYKGIDILLKPAPAKSAKKYNALVSVNGKTIALTKVYLKINGGSPMNPNIEYIEFTGKDHKTGKPLVEKIKPEKPM